MQRSTGAEVIYSTLTRRPITTSVGQMVLERGLRWWKQKGRVILLDSITRSPGRTI
jgi:transcription termination factor Rho